MNEIIRQDIEWLIENVDEKQFDNSKILITGASGAIARYLVHFFMQIHKSHGINCDVHALVRDSKKAENIFHDWLKEENFYLHIGNVEENDFLAKDMTYIFHAAGDSATRICELYPVDILQANVIGTEGLLAASRGNNQLKKFVFFSSGAVYGDLPDVFATVTENIYYSLNPYSMGGVYAEAKRMGELLCYSYWKQYDISTTAVRIGHSYGPGINLQSKHIYSDIVKTLLEKRNINIRDPEIMRPFTYVRDTIFGILLVALSKNNGQAYNVWNAKGRIPVGKVVDTLFYKTFKKLNLKIYYNNTEYHYNGLYDEKKLLDVFDTKKIENLGWQAYVGIEEGFSRTVKSFELNN